MSILLRRERPSDHRAAESLTREAFFNLYVPGCAEHYLLHFLRDAPAFVPELAWVAESDGQLLGSIVYSRSHILRDNGQHTATLTFGPVAVLPSWQGQGIGSQLIRHTLALAREQGEGGVIILGDPAYYSRFGFVPAEHFDIRTGDEHYADALQALELKKGHLAPGRFVEAPVFDMEEQQIAIFDQGFPPKEKKSGLLSQARFMEIASRRRPR